MALPFSFHGSFVVHQHATDILEKIDGLVSKLTENGATELERKQQTISFRGVNRLEITPLQTIAKGHIELVQISYTSFRFSIARCEFVWLRPRESQNRRLPGGIYFKPANDMSSVTTVIGD